MKNLLPCCFTHFPFRYGHVSDALQQLSYLPARTAYNMDTVPFRFHRSLSPFAARSFTSCSPGRGCRKSIVSGISPMLIIPKDEVSFGEIIVL